MNGFDLRDYQVALYDEARALILSGSRSILIQLPTGAGKTVLVAKILDSAAGKGYRAWFTVHRRELVKQSILTFTQSTGREVGVVAAGFPGNRRLPIQIASIGMLRTRRALLQDPHLIVYDECHHLVAASWDEIHKAYPSAIHIGVTATPERLDGRGLGGYFGELIVGPPVSWLIERGHLSKYKMFAPAGPNLDGVHTVAGDFNKRELAAAMKKSTVVGDVIEHYRRHASGKRMVLFAWSVDSSIEMAGRFNAAGIPAAHVDGGTRTHDRDKAVDDFKAGRVLVLCNVDLFGEGVDVPAIEAIALLRPTQSLALYLQQCLDVQTEILSRRGWLKCDAVSGDDEVAAFDVKTGEIEWCGIKAFVKRPLADDEGMLEIAAPHLSLRVTGGHDLIVRGDSGTCKNWRKQNAGDAAMRLSTFTVPVSGNEAAPGAPLSDDEVRFLGWFLTDGTLNKLNNAVSISQSAGKPVHCAAIRSAIIGAGLKFGECRIRRKGEYAKYADLIMFTVSRGTPRGRDKHLRGWAALAPWIDKSLPTTYEQMDVRQVGLLIEAMNLGDGANADKTITWTRRTMSLACGDNEVMADRLQSLLVRRGFRCNKSVQRVPGRRAWFYLHIRKASTASIAGANVSNGSISGKPYERSRLVPSKSEVGEVVWCVSNRLGTLVVRRHGKVVVVGNCGRGLRPSPGKDYAIILDHAGNCRRFGLPDDAREWSLEGRKRGRAASDAAPIRQCSQCYAVMSAAAIQCVHCGFRFLSDGRSINEVDGDLHEIEVTKISREEMMKRRELENARAETLDELVAVGKLRGYKKPEKWAHHVYAARMAKRAKKEALAFLGVPETASAS